MNDQISQLHALRLKIAAYSQTLAEDRKSTRLNSSHGYISYAVFCLKKKTDHADNILCCIQTLEHLFWLRVVVARDYLLMCAIGKELQARLPCSKLPRQYDHIFVDTF